LANPPDHTHGNQHLAWRLEKLTIDTPRDLSFQPLSCSSSILYIYLPMEPIHIESPTHSYIHPSISIQPSQSNQRHASNSILQLNLSTPHIHPKGAEGNGESPSGIGILQILAVLKRLSRGVSGHISSLLGPAAALTMCEKGS
jgi:hypothetical protein